MIDLLLTCKVSKQLNDCYKKHGNYASFSEAMSVLREEFEELWDEHKKKELNFDRIESEIIDNLVVLNKMYFDIVVKKNNR